jgi:magnesium-transporting ATPase (P-type)
MFITGVAVWLLLLGSCWLVPKMQTYMYAMLWAGLGALAAGLFVVGYLRYSKPTKDPVTRKRKWSGTWVWLLAQSVIVLLVVGMNFALRFINVETAVFTADRIEQYRFTAAVFATVFVQQVWLLWMWIGQQIDTRRALRFDAAVGADAPESESDGVR